jgi:two-component system, OmpR family, sensor histidine kinase KdpD
LVCLSPSLSSAKLISSAKRMAASLNAKWYAVYVEEPNVLNLPEAERNRAVDHLRLAEQLGAETVLLSGRNIAEELINFARQRHITKIVAGKPRRSIWKSIFLRSPLDQLLRISGEIDVYVITGEREELTEASYVVRPKKVHLSDYETGILFLILANVICFMLYPHFHLSNLIMVYLLGVMLTATSCGRGPAVLISCLSVLSFDFFFIPPRFSFTVEDAQDIVTFMVMLLVALVISQLASRMRQQAGVAHLQERQAAAMHGLSRQLASTRGVGNILKVAIQYISEVFDCQVLVMLPDEKGKLHIASGDLGSVFEKDIIKEMNNARSAFNTGKMVGWGAEASPKTGILFTPLQAVNVTLGVIALRPGEPERFMLQEQLHLLESLVKQVALALEVERLTGIGEIRP